MNIMTLLQSFHFLRPYWLWLLPVIAILLFLLRRKPWTSYGYWEKVCDAHLLPYLTNQEKVKKKYWGLYLLSLAWLLTIIALAGPTWSKDKLPVYQPQAATIILFDLSPQMLATDIKPNRITRARYKLRDILNLPEGQMGLIAFSGQPFVVSPLTDDHQTLALFLSELDPSIMPIDGHNIEHGLKKAAELLRHSDVKKGHILLVTAAPTVKKAAINTAKQLRKSGITTTVLSLGQTQGAPVKLPNGEFLKDQQGNIIVAQTDNQGLRVLANASGSLFVPFSQQNQDVDTIKNILEKQQFALQRESMQMTKVDIWKDQGHWFIWAVLPLSLIMFRRGWLDVLLH